MKTTVAVTSQNKRTVTNHAGKCTSYLIYTIEKDKVTNKRLLELEHNETLRYTFHEDQTEDPKNYLFDVDILLSGSIGKGVVDRLATQNVAAYVIREKDPDFAVEKLVKGTLEAFAPISHRRGGGSCDDHHH
ncbi:MAG: NifB/NifX family molybdenum-iron cluster-binding protein [Bacteroidota bacterium]